MKYCLCKILTNLELSCTSLNWSKDKVEGSYSNHFVESGAKSRSTEIKPMHSGLIEVAQL